MEEASSLLFSFPRAPDSLRALQAPKLAAIEQLQDRKRKAVEMEDYERLGAHRNVRSPRLLVCFLREYPTRSFETHPIPTRQARRIQIEAGWSAETRRRGISSILSILKASCQHVASVSRKPSSSPQMRRTAKGGMQTGVKLPSDMQAALQNAAAQQALQFASATLGRKPPI